MDTPPIIELKGVAISHDEGQLLSAVNVSVMPGEFVYLIGKSGAGKTSLLRTLYADRPIDSGGCAAARCPCCAGGWASCSRTSAC